MNKKQLLKWILAALFLALALLLPLVTGQIRLIGKMLLPMHLPVLLCGLICGWRCGLAVGFTAPFLRSALFGMPILYPNAVGMAFELAAYGCLIGLLYQRSNRKNLATLYAALLTAMLGGRLIWGAARFLLMGLGGSPFTLAAFWTGAVTEALPGILLQLLLIPSIMLILQKIKALP